MVRRDILAAVAAIAAIAFIVGCGSSSSSGPVTLNWYVFPEPSGSFADGCHELQQGLGRRVQHQDQLPLDSSDQQRVSLVRRLAANDSSIDILAMDVDWTAEFATAKWIRPGPGAARRADPRAGSSRAGSDRDLEGQALGGPDQLEHRAAVVPQGPRPEPAQDLDADDRRRRRS